MGMGAITGAPNNAVSQIRQVATRRDLTAFLIGASITLVTVLASIRAGAALGLGGLILMVVFLALVTSWMVAPHWVVAFAIPLFALVPAGKVLLTPWVGPMKDLVILAAVGAIVPCLSKHRRRSTAFDRPAIVLIVSFLGLYIVNVGGVISGGHHGLAWAQGVRLVAEPLILLAAGLTLRQPARALSFAAVSLIITGCMVALYGIAQQQIGGPRLVSLGYSYTSQVRTFGANLRSFGTLDDPFTYAAFLLLALATVMFWMRPGWLAAACGCLIGIGIAVSFVRTAILIVIALLAIWLVRHHQPTVGFVLLGASAAVGLAVLLGSSGASETRSVRAGPQEYITLNGRTTVWRKIFRNPANLPFGLGVGKVGTAAERAQNGVSVTPEGPTTPTVAVDSGYFAAVADVGLIGLAVLLALFVRLLTLGIRGTSRRSNAGWLVVAFMTVLLIDATSRASFTGFPTAFLGMLLVGLSVATSTAETHSRAASF